MTSSSLKEQLQAVASQLSPDGKTKQQGGNQKRSAKPERTQSSRRTNKTQSDRKAQHKSPKPKWLEYAQYGVELLKAYYPGAFPEGPQPKPLKVGIKQELVKALSKETEITIEDKACMVKSLAYYVNTLSYLRCVKTDIDRVDLDGRSAGKVTAEEAEYSAVRYQARKEGKKSSAGDVDATQVKEESAS